MLSRIRTLGVSVVLLVVLAAAGLGFAHRVPSAQEARLQAAALAGFVAADLCGDLPDAAHGMDCPVCHLVGAIPVPGADVAVARADLRLLAVLSAPRESRAIRPVRDPALGLRAPPFA